MAVHRLFWSLESLNELKAKGYGVGQLKWKSPSEYRSIVYNQSGFDVDSNTVRTDHAILRLSGIGDLDVDYHRELPVGATIKQVILKYEKSGKWHASIIVDQQPDYPDKPPASDIDLEDTVGIDLGITSFIHDSDGGSLPPLNETEDRERIEKRHRSLSRKLHGSNNWEKARQGLAVAYERLSNRRTDYREKLAHAYTTHYDAVFLEDLHVRGMLEQDWNGRNIAAMSWRKTIQAFERHGEKNGCHVETVPPEGTTKRCAQCDVESQKRLWIREHSCPACGFEEHRDRNSVYNIQKLGLEELGIDYNDDELLGLGEAEGTPAETVFPAGSDPGSVVGSGAELVKHVGETGSRGSPVPR
jgi:putative transposase